MKWFEFLKDKKKISLLQCQKFLGSGAFGLTYLTTDNLVVKIEPVYTKELTVGDTFGMQVVPTLNYEVRKHFIQIYSVQFLDYNPLPHLKCLEPGIERKFKFYNKTDIYKVTVMEYGGSSFELNDGTALRMVKQLFNPVCVMLSMGYFHYDIFGRNIVVKDGVYRIIDYGVMNKVNEINLFQIDFSRIIRNNLYSLLSVLLPSVRLDKNWDLLIKSAKNFKGPKKYGKYPETVWVYTDLFEIQDPEYTYLVDSQKLLDAIYYIFNYKFYPEGYDELSTQEYYEKVCKKAFYSIAKKVTTLLDLNV